MSEKAPRKLSRPPVAIKGADGHICTPSCAPDGGGKISPLEKANLQVETAIKLRGTTAFSQQGMEVLREEPDASSSQ